MKTANMHHVVFLVGLLFACYDCQVTKKDTSGKYFVNLVLKNENTSTILFIIVLVEHYI